MAQKKNAKKVIKKTTTKKPVAKKKPIKKSVKKEEKTALHLFPMFALAVLAVTGVVAGCKIANEQKFLDTLQVSKVEDYLYEINYSDEFDWGYGQEFLTSRYANANAGKCSSVRNGDFVGRNYDWYYDESSDFIIRTKATDNRHASIGVANGTTLLLPEKIDSGTYSNMYKVLPFLTLDGVNDAGVAVNINVVNLDETHGLTTGTNPEGENLMAMAIPRFVLDNANSVDDAINKLRARNIYGADSEKLVEEFHFMISDGNKTVVVEFIDNEMVVLENENIMTNFYLSGFDKSEAVLPEYAMGIERYNILRDNYVEGGNMDGMKNLMKRVYYTKAYDLEQNPFWYSEFSGVTKTFGKLTTNNVGEAYIGDNMNRAGDYKGILELVQSYHRSRNRKDGKKVWQTVHSTIYDLKNKKMKIIPQESNNEYEYSL